MRRYETIFILRPNSGEEEINKVIDYTTQIIADEQGTVIELNKWGMKKLAYPIKKEGLGFYVFCDYAGTPAAVTEIERKFRIDDTVLKYMTVKTAAEITPEGIEQAIVAVSAKAESMSEEEVEDENDEDDDDQE